MGDWIGWLGVWGRVLYKFCWTARRGKATCVAHIRKPGAFRCLLPIDISRFVRLAWITRKAYGERSRGTRLFRDQLWLTDNGSWQIADRYYTAS